ncbi:beta-glucosidase BglX [Enterococcus wangshanyuanii]|uniref:beta-glucosidase n=1 Tax=Enterococcus wangshanyuanii TaxID=2005703 RepID=A0ABQ1P5N1_9ENTE|nr:beta-glucosidase BglX [Enterococcus wangshanyuanii]GGC89384.1 beta-glucosidase [Enterococcus wangshanyuanii]
MEEKALKELLASLTWEEKIGQLVQLSGDFFHADQLAVGPQKKLGIDQRIVDQVGSVLNVTGAEKTREIQERHMEKSRHKIPLLFMADIIYGYRTIFPIPLGLGATWNPALIESAYQQTAEESKAAGAHVTFAPMVDLVRDARWGRTLEATGEDPVLNAAFAKAMVAGLQKDLLNGGGIASCVKHFAAYGAAEGGREYNTVDMSERRLRQEYLPAYKAAVDAGCQLVMTSFNTYDGVPVTGNQFLLKEILRKEWGFDGVIISDYAAIQELIAHGVAVDDREAAKLAIEATTDIDMKTPCYAKELEPLIEAGEISAELVDQSVYRVLKLKNDLGLFEDPYRGASQALEERVFLTEEKRQLARKVSAESVVLLQNKKNVLPLEPNKEKILLVGPYGDNQELIGLWAVHGQREDVVTIKKGFEKYLDSKHLLYTQGCDMLEDYTFLGEFGATKDQIEQLGLDKQMKEKELAQALSLAKQADTIVFALGEHTMQSGEAGSRTDITLPKIQQAFLQQLVELKKKTVLIVISGRPLVLTKEVEQVDAILQAWFPGTEGGNALADIIFGETNPSGRLSMSFPYSVGQLPLYYSEFKTGRPLTSPTHKGRFVSKYLDSPNEPLFSFGFGLSYSKVDYSGLTLSNEQMTETLTISVNVKNSSARPTLETVQLYIQDVTGSVVRPVKELKAFQKVTLAAGEEKKVSFCLDREKLKFYTKEMIFAEEPGAFIVFVGPNVNETLEASFELV